MQEEDCASMAFVEGETTAPNATPDTPTAFQTAPKVDETAYQKENDEAKDRILKRGDLARINSRRQGKHKDHDGDLGRIVKAIPTDENDGTFTHPFHYEVELIMGGKLHGVTRSDLIYTTASQEGMTGDSRVRRKRRSSLAQEAANETTKKEKAKPKKKQPTKKQKKAPTTKTTKAAIKASKKRGAANSEKSKSTSKKARTAPADDPTPPSQGMDMYERHRREFERSVVRLEKADTYQYFTADVPDEFDERCIEQKVETIPDTNSSSQQSGANSLPPTELSSIDLSSTIQQNPSDPYKAQHEVIISNSQSPSPEGINDKKSTKKKCAQSIDDTIHFPSHPPYNLLIVRKRMERGHYVQDRELLENEEHTQLLTPYFQSIGKTISKRSNKKAKTKSRIPVLHPKGVNWDLFRQDIIGMCDAAVARNSEPDCESAGSLGFAVKKIKDLMEQIYEKSGQRSNVEIFSANDRHRFSLAMDSTDNAEAAMQGKWRRDAFPERQYERLKTDAVCAGLSELDERIASYELRTTLKDSFVGLSYTYDDTGQSEGWMKSVLSETGEQSEQQKASLALAADDGVIKAQVAASIQSLLIAVQDRVMTELGVLEQSELTSSNWMVETKKSAETVVAKKSSAPEIVEQPVWGIDCYTRRNISICLQTELDSDTVLTFVEKWLLPAINACPVDLACDVSNAARILEGLPFDNSSWKNEDSTTTDSWSDTLLGKALMNKIASSGPPWLKAAANMLQRARESLGPDFFRIHPKGHGSIVLCPKLESNRLVTFYRGEVYPSWRWGEKMDAISVIQEKKGLKPVLPDFFNMALERPQMDPRGYGLLFVDASRKSGYGSMLSHSCQPSCEVRVAAVNGELTLAMTTLREMTIGDELTFDYNAVTESLNEYQSAVCLCGHGQCRGAFLHFAAADCYQQILNRNSPVAVRLSNLIKGCMKKVMSEDDDGILKRHGFLTAAFGAVSVNRRKATDLDKNNPSLDSMDIVPVWLRTFVADALRYIEYERRALPIALLCNDIFDESTVKKEGVKTNQTEIVDLPESDDPNLDEDDDKRIKGWKPEPTFFFFARMQRIIFVSLLMEEDDNKTLSGMELKRAIQKLASVHWRSLDAEGKAQWKEQAFKEWENNGGKEKARLEEERRIARSKNKSSSKSATKASSKKEPSKSANAKGEKQKTGSFENSDKSPPKPKISFQSADGEGISAMEQRIQQLTQTLSRIGRVLDRHREESLGKHEDDVVLQSATSDEFVRSLVHSPLSIMPDEHVVAWMWSHDDAPVRTLLKLMENEVCVSPSMKTSLWETESKYGILKGFGTPWVENSQHQKYPLSPTEGRKLLNEALLEFRQKLLDGIQGMATELKNRKSSLRKETARKKKEQTKENEARLKEKENADIRSILAGVMNEMLDAVEERSTGVKATKKDAVPLSVEEPQSEDDTKKVPDESEEFIDSSEPWLKNYSKRFKLEKAADVLLLYARTSTFFSLKAYESLKSTPIEVYARELGNAVPNSAKDYETPDTSKGASQNGPKNESEGEHLNDCTSMDVDSPKQVKKPKSRLCEPEDIISNVVIEYQGDYVLSQLLQWYNAGIGQKPGLPDIMGCAMLPSMIGSWTIENKALVNSHTDRATRYQSATRRKLIEWIKDPLKRGSPWPDDIRRAFIDKAEDKPIADATSTWIPLGSPILDFLVTGDDFNINSIVETLGSFYSSSISLETKSASDGLLSSVDHGRPAQAVSNWVQCEHSDCLKWRKVPWHVDIDMLSEQFFCKDNKWNPKYASCNAPADEWNEATDAQVGADGSATHIESEPKLEASQNDESTPVTNCKLAEFKLGARFDFLRPNKDKWSVGTVVKLDLSSEPKRVQLHCSKMQIKPDEWIEMDSPRIAPLHSKTPLPAKKESSTSTAKKMAAGPRKEKASVAILKRATMETSTKKDDSMSKSVPVERKSKSFNLIQEKGASPSLESVIAHAETKPSPAFTDFSHGDGSDGSSRQSNAVTDESSPDDSERRKKADKPKKADKSKEKGSSQWTIPRRKNASSTKTSLLQNPSNLQSAVATLTVVKKGRTESDPATSRDKSASRIPRKQLSSADQRPISLLQNITDRRSSKSTEQRTHENSIQRSQINLGESHGRQPETKTGSPRAGYRDIPEGDNKGANYRDAPTVVDDAKSHHASRSPLEPSRREDHVKNGSRDEKWNGLPRDSRYHEERKYRGGDYEIPRGRSCNHDANSRTAHRDSHSRQDRLYTGDNEGYPDRTGQEDSSYNVSPRDSHRHDQRRYRQENYEESHDRTDYEGDDYRGRRRDYKDHSYRGNYRDNYDGDGGRSRESYRDAGYDVAGYDDDRYQKPYRDTGYDDDRYHRTYRDSDYDAEYRGAYREPQSHDSHDHRAGDFENAYDRHGIDDHRSSNGTHRPKVSRDIFKDRDSRSSDKRYYRSDFSERGKDDRGSRRRHSKEGTYSRLDREHTSPDVVSKSSTHGHRQRGDQR